jgi:hypothetical protein
LTDRARLPARGRSRWLLALAAVAAVACVLVLAVISADRPAAAQRGGAAITAAEVISAFQAAGLPVDNPRQQPVRSSPSGPPATEREAWAFSIPAVAPSGGRILVFDVDERLNKKAAWFRRSGATVTVAGNIILWLDPGVEGQLAARYRQALRALR